MNEEPENRREKEPDVKPVAKKPKAISNGKYQSYILQSEGKAVKKTGIQNDEKIPDGKYLGDIVKNSPINRKPLLAAMFLLPEGRRMTKIFTFMQNEMNLKETRWKNSFW